MFLWINSNDRPRGERDRSWQGQISGPEQGWRIMGA